MLSNFDLEEMAEKDNLDLIGVFNKDMLPKERVMGSYIVNLQDFDDGQGTHWVCFKIFENKKCCYFDSFGLPMPQEVNSFLMPFKPVAQNNRTIQDLKSIKCGYFCYAFIKYFDNFNSKTQDVFEAYDDFLNCFSNSPRTNDKIVMELINKY
jgi:hypothetical protein